MKPKATPAHVARSRDRLWTQRERLKMSVQRSMKHRENLKVSLAKEPWSEEDEEHDPRND